MPIKIDDKDITSLIGKLLPEFNAYYGPNTTVELQATLSPQGDKAMSLVKDQGLIIGDKNNVIIQMAIYATNSSAPLSLAASFEMNFQMVANFSI